MDAEKDPDSIRSELRRFGETVSVRGVSHIFKSTGTFVKVCWLLAVLISCTLLVWQLSAVFLKYFSFQITSTLEEVQDFPTFPDVSVCNLNAMTAYEDALTLTWDEFNEKVYDIASNASLEELEMMYGDLLGNSSIDDLRNDLFFDLAAPTSYYSIYFSILLLPRHITPSIFRSCCSHVILLHLFFDLAAPTSYDSNYFSILLLPRHITPTIFRSCCSHVILLHLFFDLAAPTSYYSIYFSILLLPRHITPTIFRSCCSHVILLHLFFDLAAPTSYYSIYFSILLLPRHITPSIFRS